MNLTQSYLYLHTGRCIQEDCDSENSDWRSGARSLDDPQADALLEQPGDGALMASYSVFVVEPGEDIGRVVFLKFFESVLQIITLKISK